MEPEVPPAPPPQGPDQGPPPQSRPAAHEPPPVEVHAEPVPPGERGRVVDAPPPASNGGSAAPPPPPQGTPAAKPAWQKHGWAAACHLIGLVDFGVTGVPGLVASLVIWLIKKDEDPEVDFHGKQAINFQIAVIAAWVVGIVLTPCLIGVPLLLALPIVKIVLMLYATVRAANGERWAYPWTLQILR